MISSRNHVPNPGHLPQRAHAGTRRHEDHADEDVSRVARLGGRLITPDDAEWPTLAFASFAGVDNRTHPNGVAPLALWVAGELALGDVAQRAAAIVGTRAATCYGE